MGNETKQQLLKSIERWEDKLHAASSSRDFKSIERTIAKLINILESK